MPTYHCSARMGLLDAERKARIARAVTLAHQVRVVVEARPDVDE